METLQDTALIFRRQMTQSLRNPVWVIIGLVSPILYLAFFGPLLAHFSFGPATSWQIFVPGLLVQQGLFGSSFVGFGLIAEWRSGIIERMRVTPVSRLALLLGRVMRDVVVLLVQALVLILSATIFGLRAPVLGVIVSFGFMVLLGISLASISYTLALWTKDEDAFAPLLNTITLPLMLLSGILLPIRLGPAWLQFICHFNPFFYIVEAIRSAFLGNYLSWSIAEGIVVALALAAASLALGTGTFRKENV